MNRIEFDNREDWLEFRKDKITGTSAAAIFGASKYSSEYAQYMRLTGKYEPEFEVNEAMQWGSTLEPVILQHYLASRFRHTGEYEAEYGTNCDGKIIMYQDSERPWLAVSPDMQVWVGDKKTIVDSKNTVFHAYDEPPLHYLIQLVMLMHCCDSDEAVLAVLHQGNTYKEYQMDRDQTLIDNMLKKLDRWYEYCIEGDIAPEPDDSEASKKSLSKANWFWDGAEPLPDAAEVLLEERAKIMDEMKTLKKRKDKIENVVKASMEGAASAMGITWRVKRSEVHKKAYEVKESTYQRYTFARN